SYSTIITAYAEDYEITETEFNLQIQDKRKNFSRKLPTGVFTTAAYSDLADNDVDKPIPLAWGTIRKAPVVCINDSLSAAATYNFKICDTTNHAISTVQTVYVDGVEVTPTAISVGSATFSVSGGSAITQYEPGDACTVDFVGYVSSGTVIENSLDVIKDILGDYLSIVYSSDTYDTAEWASAESDVYNIGLWVDEEKEIYEIIEEISRSNFGNFMIKADGKYSFRLIDESKDAVLTLEQDELFDPAGGYFPTDEFLTSVSIKYNREWNTDKFRRHLNTDQQTAIFNTYGTYRQREFETLVSQASAASALSTRIISLFDEIKPVFSNSVKLQASQLELMDNINLEVNRLNATMFGSVKAYVTGIAFELDNFFFTVQVRLY
ncbi:MAG: hypothetical protein ACYS0I_22295, partial [Planctomycetota bacterium]